MGFNHKCSYGCGYCRREKGLNSNPHEGVHLTEVMKVKENEKIFNFSVPKFKELFILWRVQVNVSTHRQKINLVNNKWFEPDGTKNGTFYATCCEELGYFMSVRRLLQAYVVIFKGVTPHFSLNIYDYNDSFCMLKAKHILFLAKKKLAQQSSLISFLFTSFGPAVCPRCVSNGIWPESRR